MEKKADSPYWLNTDPWAPPHSRTLQRINRLPALVLFLIGELDGLNCERYEGNSVGSYGYHVICGLSYRLIRILSPARSFKDLSNS